MYRIKAKLNVYPVATPGASGYDPVIDQGEKIILDPGADGICIVPELPVKNTEDQSYEPSLYISC